MRNTIKRAYVVYLLVAAFFVGLGFMAYSYITHGEKWVTNRVNSHLYTNRQLTTAGTVFDSTGKVLVSTKDGKRIYNSDSSIRKAVLHCVGDTEGFISTGVQTVYRPYLIGYDFVNGVYGAVKGEQGNDITLTINAELCKTAYEALGSNRGTIGVYNYKTGEVICMVSTPTYDPLNKPSTNDINTLKSLEGVYINRFLQGIFTPGSTFKTVTAISAYENIENFSKLKYNCEGSHKIGSDKINCYAGTAHGKVGVEGAYNRSCNVFFARTAIKLGHDNLAKTANELGFNKNLYACGVELKTSLFTQKKKISEVSLGWTGIGQGETLANPCHMMMIAGAIANGGEAVTPTLIKKTGALSSLSTLEIKPGSAQIKIDSEIAGKMKKLMRSNVVNQYGEAKNFNNLKMCGKTGSAERAGDKPHAWFFGFSAREDFPYAIVVVAENAGMATSVAIPAASKVMAKAYSIVKAK